MKVLSFGSLNIDYVYKVPHFVEKGETLSSLSLNTFSGGKGLNQSIALAKAGMQVYHAGAIGKDGMFLADQLKAAGVDLTYLMIRETERTGHAIIQNDASGDNNIILYGGANQTITPEEAESVIANFEKGDILVLQNEISSLGDIIRAASKQGMKIVLNPSPMNENILALPLELVDMFVLNEGEGSRLAGREYGRDVSGTELAALLRKTYPRADIVLTLGSEGSVACTTEGAFEQGVFKVKAVDTTAAGDTYTGFLIAALAKGQGCRAAMELGAKASAIAVTRPGASPSIPALEEVEHTVL